jgi:hypothetical protein
MGIRVRFRDCSRMATKGTGSSEKTTARAYILPGVSDMIQGGEWLAQAQPTEDDVDSAANDWNYSGGQSGGENHVEKWHAASSSTARVGP